jgi:hypothetical protein
MLFCPNLFSPLLSVLFRLFSSGWPDFFKEFHVGSLPEFRGCRILNIGKTFTPISDINSGSFSQISEVLISGSVRYRWLWISDMSAHLCLWGLWPEHTCLKLLELEVCRLAHQWKPHLRIRIPTEKSVECAMWESFSKTAKKSNDTVLLYMSFNVRINLHCRVTIHTIPEYRRMRSRPWLCVWTP